MPLRLKDDFIPLPLSTITADNIYEFDLYQNREGQPVLYRHKSTPITDLDLEDLRSWDCRVLYVPVWQENNLRNHLEDDLPATLKNPHLPVKLKFEILCSVSEKILEQVFTDPTSQEAVGRAVNQCKNHVIMAMAGNAEKEEMIKERSKAPFAIAHAMTVANFSILLGVMCGIDDTARLHEIGVGGMFHEIGKTVIDADYYLRSDPTNKISDTRMKRYPLVGTEILKRSGIAAEVSLRVIREHQERLDGSGFPERLSRGAISQFSRIVAICDYFDEEVNAVDLRTTRKPFDVLLTMKRAGSKFDQKILREFILLLGSEFNASGN